MGNLFRVELRTDVKLALLLLIIKVEKLSLIRAELSVAIYYVFCLDYSFRASQDLNLRPHE